MDAVGGQDAPRPGVPAGADPSVDWPAALRQVRRWGLAAVVPVLGGPAGILLLTGHLYVVPARAAWWVAGGWALVFGVAIAVAARLDAHPKGQERSLLHAALRTHADPGTDLRPRVDRLARAQRSVRWAWWGSPLAVLGSLSQGDWSSPVRALPGAVLVVLFWGGLTAQLLWTSAAGRRWLEEPPGPPREMPPPAGWDRRAGTRVLVTGALALVALGLVVELVVVVAR